jgi:hypothetical protein
MGKLQDIGSSMDKSRKLQQIAKGLGG